MIHGINSKADVFRNIKEKKLTAEEGVAILKQFAEKEKEKHNKDKIAVIGMSGRFPGASNIDEFWNNLKNGVDSVKEIPVDRFDVNEYYDSKNTSNKTYCRCMGSINNADKFDSLFFHISPSEALQIDPQQRLFLEESFHALEDAGYSEELLKNNKCGVFVGVGHGDYIDKIVSEGCEMNTQLLLGSQSSMIPARIAYYLNLKGPNMPVDTACSSSLVAVHEACMSIKNGECDMAIAGGVCILTTPNLFIMASSGEMLSKTGRCKVFDDSADGFVPSEGVGVVVLKSLDQAVKDRDHIYGIICGSGINHDGKTNGITAPSSESQSALEKEVYNKYGIDPEKITYIETHGTGTKLGDPIEVSALKHTFSKYTAKEQYCALGSVKANIGHALPASGIISLIKVLLCIKNRQLTPSIHYDKINEHINLKNSPFYINTELCSWNENQDEYAALSSFGLSGTNCHMVVSPYKNDNEKANVKDLGIHLICLSAKSKESLKKRIYDLKNWLIFNHSNVNLNSLEYTLNVGRDHFRFRAAFIIKDCNDLISQLSSYYLEKDEVVRNEEFDYEQFKADLNNIYKNKGLEDVYKLVRNYYLCGKIDEFSDFYKESISNKISAPTYPFIGKSYWNVKKPEIKHTDEKRISSLIIDNQSTLNMQKYRNIFYDDQSFIRDHIIMKKKMVPGAAQIEMIFQALSVGVEHNIQTLKKVYFMNGIFVDNKKTEVWINASKHDNIIYVSLSGMNNYDEIIYSTTEAMINNDPEKYIIKIDEIEERCKNEKKDYYDIYKKSGVFQGKTMQTIKKLMVGNNEALAVIDCNEDVLESTDYYLNPSLLDGAFQTVIAFEDGESEVYVPFSIEELNVYGSLNSESYVYIRKRFSENEKEKRYDIIVSDKLGNVIVKIINYCARRLYSQEIVCAEYTDIEKEIISADIIEGRSLLLFDYDDNFAHILRKYYHNVILVNIGKDYKKKNSEHYVINPMVLDDFKSLMEDMTNEGNVPENWLYLWTNAEKEVFYSSLSQIINVGFDSILNLTKSWILNVSEKKVKMIYQYDKKNEISDSLHNAYAAFAKTAYTENPSVSIKVVAFDNYESLKKAELIKAEFDDTEFDNSRNVYYSSEKRYIKNIRIIDERLSEKAFCWKEGGVYLLAGGFGGIGRHLARHILLNVNANIIIIGRSQLDNELLSELNNVNKNSCVDYYVCDITNKNDVKKTIDEVVKKYGTIDALLQLAGVIHDNFILKKNPNDVKKVLDTKIIGTINLDEATANIKLDYFVLFSAVAGVLGNVGQCDYAFANQFLDEFSRYRGNLVKENKRSGKTISINWPLWKDGGMMVDDSSKEYLQNSLGMEALTTRNGMKILESILNSDMSEVMVVGGNKEKIKSVISQISTNKIKENEMLNISNVEVEKKAEKVIRKILSEALNMSPQDFSIDEPFENYGIDSVMIIKINELLEKEFGPLSKTLLFEYQDMGSLVKYFAKNKADHFAENNKDKVHYTENKKSISFVEEINSTKSAICNLKTDYRNKIAVIGLSGRFPQAENIQEFWKNLVNGKDCIEEIPEERWKWQDYYSEINGNGKCNCKFGGFIKDVDKFDALFFQISPRDAEFMDPQERLFLENTWSLFEDAGYKKSDISGKKIGVYVGSMYSQYQLEGLSHSTKDCAISTASSHASIANRVSYYFDLHGPSMAIDTMCSSSLTSIHLACQALRLNECEMAVAGGVNITTNPDKYVMLGQGNFTSANGRCRSFGENADGYVPGEGVGAILLKPLDKALEDGDNIYGVIIGSAENHGGKTNGYTVPNPKYQTDVIVEAIKNAEIDPRNITYIEAHGTGTKLGDPIEITGIKNAFENFTNDKGFCALGSVKSNIGHLEGAAGIAGVAKVLLQFRNKTLVPTIHAEIPNSFIDFCDTPVYLQRELSEWKVPENCSRRYAGISAFGAGGANVHMIFADTEPVLNDWSKMKAQPCVFLLSAEYDDQLRNYAEKYIAFLNEIRGKKCENIRNANNDSQYILEKIKKIFADINDTNINEIESDKPISEYTNDKFFINIFSSKVSDSFKLDNDDVKVDEYSTIESIASEIRNILDRNSNDIITKDVQLNQIDLLRNITYTQQVGREVFSKRLAIVTSSIEDCIRKLNKFISASAFGDDIFYGDKVSHDILDERIDFAYTEKKWNELAKLWAMGAKIDWRKLYDKNYTKMSLPTYPFAGKRHWVGEFKPVNKADSSLNMVIKTNSSKDNELYIPSVPRKPAINDSEQVKLEIINDSIALVTIDDKENNNTLTESVILGLELRFYQIYQNKNIKVVVVTGRDNVFCMGGTKQQLMDISEGNLKFTDSPFIFKGFLECQVPVITAVQGHAMGGGFMFALYGDIVVLSEEGVYSAVFMKYGFTPGMGATYILKEKLGQNLATEMMLTARNYTGEHLKQRGTSTIIVKQKDVLNEALSIAQSIAEKPIVSIKLLKKDFADKALKSLMKYINEEVKMHDITFVTPEVKEKINYYYGNGRKKQIDSSEKKVLNDNNIEVNTKELNNNINIKKKNDVELQLKQIVSNILHMDQCEINIETSFQALGVDSISGVEIIRDINKALKIDLDSVILYDYPNIKELADYIASQKIHLIQESSNLAVTESKNQSETVYLSESIANDNNKLDFNEIIDKVRDIVMSILHLSEEEIDNNKNFKDLGIDSISSVEIIRDVNNAFNLSLDAIILYDYSTINDLSELISEKAFSIKATEMKTEKDFKEKGFETNISVKNKIALSHKDDIKIVNNYSKENIKVIVRNIVKNILHLSDEEIDDDKNFKDIGIDSISSVEVIRDINNTFSLSLDAVILYDYSTVSTLAEYVYNQAEKKTKNITDSKIDSIEKPLENKTKISLTLKSMPSEPQKIDGTQKSKITLKSHKHNEANELKKDEINDNIKKTFLKDNEKSELAKSITDTHIKSFDAVTTDRKIEDIAIIGISGKYPGSENVYEYWNNIEQKKVFTGNVPEDRMKIFRKFNNEIEEDQLYLLKGGFINGVEYFDPLFFQITPKEAIAMDPQQRLFLQEAWRALEDAGYSDRYLSYQKCGVFVGTSSGDYGKLIALKKENNIHSFTGLSPSVLAGRVSYLLNLIGPSIALDTACSSSLVAIHEACKSIRNQECTMAIAGGVMLLLTPELFLKTSQIGMLSPTGKLRPFDKNSDGIVISEGVGAVILKPLSKAIQDGDYIYGVIKGSGINQDGRTNGLTAPSAKSQTKLELDIYERYNIDPSNISYIETHGTGTSLGDPIEFKALKESFEKYTDKKQFCALGSVKGSIGHSLMASGVASVIKVLMAMKNKKIPGMPMYDIPNEHIDLENSPFYIPKETIDWTVTDNKRRIAGISAFGFSGTNCHMVIEESPFRE